MARDFVYSSWGDILTWFLRIEFVMDDEKLVEVVRSLPSLSKIYKAKENAWKEMASMVSAYESYYLKPDSVCNCYLNILEVIAE